MAGELLPLPSLDLPPLGADPLSILPHPRRRVKRARRETLSEQERASLLKGALGGLAYVGGAIDKPFAATRGLVASVGDSPLEHSIYCLR